MLDYFFNIPKYILVFLTLITSMWLYLKYKQSLINPEVKEKKSLKHLIDSTGGRRFIGYMAAGFAAAVLVFYGKIDANTFGQVIIWTYGIFVTGNVAQRGGEGLPSILDKLPFGKSPGQTVTPPTTTTPPTGQ